MIKDIYFDTTELSSKLEELFPDILKKNQIVEDFKLNVFTKYFVYTIDAEIVGFVHYEHIYDRFDIVDIAVLDKYRNRGIGSNLLNELINRAKIELVKNITLEVKNSNCPAIRLYERHGFIKRAVREKYYDGIDGILMEKEMM